MENTNCLLESVREDDFVEYFLFPSTGTNFETDSEDLLSNILARVNRVVEKYTTEFLWHKDPFNVSVRTSEISNILNHVDDKKDNLPPHLYGISHYGDNIEDEWFMVFLLQQITKEVTGLIARVHDADGEFLLIEAADCLPSWANPDTCQNRVYIYDGNVHLIPPASTEEYEISVVDALHQICQQPSITEASPDLQNLITNKLEGYPQKIQNNLHRATVFIPAGVAAILKHKPGLVAPAVQAFCNRDPLDLKACRAMKYFPPENRVLTQVTFTKCLYAMVAHSKYLPDRRTGWNLPVVNSPEYKAHILGVKVACGFEILVSQAKPSGDESDKGWQTYLKSLTDKGYFKGLLANSKEHNALLSKAREYYATHSDSMRYASTVGQDIWELTKTLEFNTEELRKEGEDLPKDDDDSWLDMSPEELDKMLQEKYGQKKIFNFNNNSDAGNFTQKLSSFLNHVSDVEGAEFPTEPPVRPPRNKNKVSFTTEFKTEPSVTNNKVNLDPNAFACAVQNILNFVIPEDDSWTDSDSDMSEYEEDAYVKEQSYEDAKTKMQEYMDEMDKELAKTTIGKSFQKKANESFDDIESFQPVDIDVNALKNILESYRSQLGEAGPSSNMLGPMGVHFDTKSDAGVD